jgi:hypothetical protein
MIKTLIFIIVGVLVCIEQGILVYKHLKPHGIFHIDEYPQKDVYRMLYLIPIDDLKKHRKLRLKVEVQKWNEMPGDFDVDFSPEDYR